MGPWGWLCLCLLVPLAQGEEEVSTTTAEPAWLGRDCVRNEDGELARGPLGIWGQRKTTLSTSNMLFFRRGATPFSIWIYHPLFYSEAESNQLSNARVALSFIKNFILLMVTLFCWCQGSNSFLKNKLKEVYIHFLASCLFQKYSLNQKINNQKNQNILVLQFWEIFAMGKSLHITPFKNPGGYSKCDTRSDRQADEVRQILCLIEDKKG